MCPGRDDADIILADSWQMTRALLTRASGVLAVGDE